MSERVSSSVEERGAADRCGGGSRRGGSSASVTCEHASAGASENRVESNRAEPSRAELWKQVKAPKRVS